MNLYTNTKLPPFLKKGDKIAIAATARKVSLEELSGAIDTFKLWGLRVVFAPGLFETENQFAGTDEKRAASFQSVLDNPEIKAIICARGGYGTIRIIDKIDFTQFQTKPKWIIGFSDLTVLQSHLVQNFGIPGIHGPMAFNFSAERANPESIEFLRNTLFGEASAISFSKHGLNQNESNIQGVLVGGNLSVLYSILGSESALNTDSKILFLEDLDEYLYHIDRMMQGLKRAGKLKNLKGLVIGDMGDMKDNAIPFGKNAYEIIADAVKEYHYPVVFGAPCGHEKKNLSLIIGSTYNLNFTNQVELIPSNFPKY